LDIHRLKVFTSVFKNKSFSKASEELHLTQPTISDHIRILEDELNCKLFDRLGRSIIPTREAELLCLHAAEIIEKADNLKDLIHSLKKEVTGELIIGASTLPGTYVLPGLMTDFKSHYPLIKYQVAISDSKEIVRKILEHELLFGIVGSKIYNEKLDYQFMMEDELIIVSSPSLIQRKDMTINELLKYPMVIREEGSGTRIEFEKILNRKGFSFDDFHIVGIFGSTDAVKQAVKAGMGVSVISRLAAADELRHKMLLEVQLKNMRMNRQFYFVVHNMRSLPPAYSLFLNHLKTKVSKF